MQRGATLPLPSRLISTKGCGKTRGQAHWAPTRVRTRRSLGIGSEGLQRWQAKGRRCLQRKERKGLTHYTHAQAATDRSVAHAMEVPAIDPELAMKTGDEIVHIDDLNVGRYGIAFNKRLVSTRSSS